MKGCLDPGNLEMARELLYGMPDCLRDAEFRVDTHIKHVLLCANSIANIQAFDPRCSTSCPSHQVRVMVSMKKQKEAWEVYYTMITVGILPNQSTFTSAWKSCSGLEA
ncbi:hypothetical protein NE237_032918 [Protea cynaroides]|uniref:Uncharacterized protein n=1 Tax=Protea cynaroides TaxID=273540 RepID=A0A9Q0L4W5_9MAGN|nr:hypothetical protein NE237_032918 [Protea cynaroides]